MNDLKSKSIEYIDFLCNQLELSDEANKIAIDILNKFPNEWGKRTSAAAFVYIASYAVNDRRTQREIANIFEINEGTIGRITKKVLNAMNKEIVEIYEKGKGRYIVLRNKE